MGRRDVLNDDLLRFVVTAAALMLNWNARSRNAVFRVSVVEASVEEVVLHVEDLELVETVLGELNVALEQLSGAGRLFVLRLEFLAS